MLFSSLVFLWIFLPFVLIIYRLLPSIKVKNLMLLAVSLFFYAWGEPKYIVLMLFSITLNYLCGFKIELASAPKYKKLWLIIAVSSNLLLLGFFKYFNFFGSIASQLTGTALGLEIVLPIGISFYTFQAMSYIIDLYRGEISLQKSWYKLALYISLFPQLIAGPIVQYADVEKELSARVITPQATAYGIKRFVYGLAKKVILANAFAAAADEIFGLATNDISTPLMWLCAILYFFQIYYDFSGYSDMAVGLGKMLGFTFKENFNYPYLAKSITDFWRRWHMSLSGWFKSYLYIPLGGNRKGFSRTLINLFIVFLCTGFWHGANWQFIAWGAYYGILLIIERLFLLKTLENPRFKIFAHIYTLLTVLCGWIIFRAPGLNAGIMSVTKIFIPYSGNPAYTVARFLDARLITLLIVGILLCGFLQQLFPKFRQALYNEEKIGALQTILIIFLLLICTMLLVSSTYNPFIYYRF